MCFQSLLIEKWGQRLATIAMLQSKPPNYMNKNSSTQCKEHRLLIDFHLNLNLLNKFATHVTNII